MAAEEEQNKGSAFRVIDRRGSAQAPSGDVDRQPDAECEAGSAPGKTGEPARPRPGAELPEMDFPTFVLSLSTSAFYHMGLVPDPETGTPADPNFDLARQTIDILEMLQVKTRGNLEGEEAQLLDSLLFDLRMRFVETRKS